MKFFKQSIFALLFISAFTSCSDDDPEQINEEELITTLTVTLTPSGGGTAVVFKSTDLDGGDGPNPPVVTPSNITLDTNTTYSGVLKVEDESGVDTENITLEVLEEDDEHQFFFSTINNIASISYDDMDDDGNPIGVAFTLTTAAAASGNLTITLLHEPDKNAAGVSSGNIANAGGETDVQGIFPITVQ